MAEETNQPEPLRAEEPRADVPAGTLPPAEAKPPRPKSRPWVIAGIIAGVLGLCVVVCVVVLAAGVGKSLLERPKVEAVLDRFMVAMRARDAASAYALFSPRAHRTVSQADVEKMLTGNNYLLFDGYRSLAVMNIRLGVLTPAGPDQLQGTVANVDGSVAYDDGFTGQLAAVLEQVNGSWMLFGVNVTVPPDKFPH